MNILFFGTLISDKQQEIFLKNGISPQPADIAQKYIIKGLSECKDVTLSCITSPRIDGFPSKKIFKVTDEKFIYENINVHCVGYLNIKYFNFVFRNSCFISECKKWARKNKVDQLTIITYSLNSTFLRGALEIKKIIPTTKICVIVSDLPQYMSNYKGIMGLLKRKNVNLIDVLRSNVDRYILYSELMAKELKLDGGYEVVEGFIDENKINLSVKQNFHERKICVYAGDLNPQYGIQKLIDSFENIKANAELHLYGNPVQAKKYRYNDNAKYCGMLNPKDIFDVFKNSDLLINPRPSSLELTKYSCPSKTFEYMASGTPCVMCKLPGIPREYFEYVFCFDNETVNGYRSTIEAILSNDDIALAKKGHLAARYLYEKKSIRKQVDKIMNQL